MTDRQYIRRTILNKRISLSQHYLHHTSIAISKRFLSSTLYLRSKRIALYFSFKGEVDTSLVLTKSLLSGKECYYPTLNQLHHNKLYFRRYRTKDKLIKNQFGILEPGLCSATIKPWAIDVVITPLVAFDPLGYRLGMGAGFYDRTFAFKNNQQRKPLLVGFAHDFQEVPSTQPEAWDVPLDFIVTETRIIHFK